MESLTQLADLLKKQLGLTPYESRAYVSLLAHGPMSPSEMARKSDIPRPRAYDVLRSLMEKGLLTEQSGKPSVYAVVEPSRGLKNLLASIETETLRLLKEKREVAQILTNRLSQMYEESKRLRPERSRVWFTQRDASFISIYTEAIKNCEREFLVASTSLQAPEPEILDAVNYALKKGVSIRVVRQITESWTLEELESYEAVLRAGSQVRYLDARDIPLRFMVFDERDVTLVFPPQRKSTLAQPLEAVWLRIPPLGKILKEYFEELWRKSKPIQPILEKMKRKKLMEKRKRKD